MSRIGRGVRHEVTWLRWAEPADGSTSAPGDASCDRRSGRRRSRSALLGLRLRRPGRGRSRPRARSPWPSRSTASRRGSWLRGQGRQPPRSRARRQRRGGPASRTAAPPSRSRSAAPRASSTSPAIALDGLLPRARPRRAAARPRRPHPASTATRSSSSSRERRAPTRRAGVADGSGRPVARHARPRERAARLRRTSYAAASDVRYRRALAFDAAPASAGGERGCGRRWDARRPLAGGVRRPATATPSTATPAETARRINIVLVPDGYRYAEKALLQATPQALVNAFRAKTPVQGARPRSSTTSWSTPTRRRAAPTSATAASSATRRWAPASPRRRSPAGTPATAASTTAPPTAAPTATRTRRRPTSPPPSCARPARDTTIVMVNTARYGGCGGTRAVYSAGNGVRRRDRHPRARPLAGRPRRRVRRLRRLRLRRAAQRLDQRHRRSPGRSGSPSSAPPAEGAPTYDSCVFRPSANCDMRALGQPFCKVCTAALRAHLLRPPARARHRPHRRAVAGAGGHRPPGAPLAFSVATRLATGARR